MKVAFVHPDLGMGGAERLVCDAAVGLQMYCGCDVTVFTSRHPENHSFAETRDGTLRVVEHGNFLPRSLFGLGLQLVCAWIRSVYLCMCILLWHQPRHQFNVVVVDQISLMNPVFRWFGLKVLFYCHFPDKLLTKRQTLLKSVYRWPLDRLEEWTTDFAHVLVVNSQFTRTVFRSAFPTIRRVPHVVYPAVNVDQYAATPDDMPITVGSGHQPALRNTSRKGNKSGGVWPPRLARLNLDAADDCRAPFVVSINRFERKKQIELAVLAFAQAVATPSRQSHKQSIMTTRRTKRNAVVAAAAAAASSERQQQQQQQQQSLLVIAGGYDKLVAENREYFAELNQLVSEQGLTDRVLFLPSFSEQERAWLLHKARCLVYTPENEHFGIVPLEAMICGTPVIAVDSGGPRETVVDGVCGRLCPPTVPAFAEAIASLLADPSLARTMGQAGRKRVQEKFSLPTFSNRLYELLKKAVKS